MKLGDRVRHKIHGFTGILTGRTEYLSGCVRIVVTSEKLDKDGEPPEGLWFDEDLVVLVKANGEKKRKPSGGPVPPPSDRVDDVRG